MNTSDYYPAGTILADLMDADRPPMATQANTTRKLARDLAPGDVIRFMNRPSQVLGITAPWTIGNHACVTVTLLDEGEHDHIEFFADREVTVHIR